jgi:protein subunit release factor A
MASVGQRFRIVRFLPRLAIQWRQNLIQQRRYLYSGNEIVNKLANDLKFRLDTSKKETSYVQSLSRYDELSHIMAKDDFWDDSTLATNLSQEFSETKSQISSLQELQQKYDETRELFRLGESENDEALLEDCELTFKEIESDLNKRKLDYMMLMDEGKSSCYVEIVAGTGGLDAFDWTKMLALMYSQWGRTMGYQVASIDENVEDYPGGGSGYRRVTLRIDGFKAYGHMAAEAGVHRLVRISPYDPKERRHTSFSQVRLDPPSAPHSLSQVRVYPVLESNNFSKNEFPIEAKLSSLSTFL